MTKTKGPPFLLFFHLLELNDADINPRAKTLKDKI